MGWRGRVSRATLADAKEARDWRIYRDFAQVLIRPQTEAATPVTCSVIPPHRRVLQGRRVQTGRSVAFVNPPDCNTLIRFLRERAITEFGWPGLQLPAAVLPPHIFSRASREHWIHGWVRRH